MLELYMDHIFDLIGDKNKKTVNLDIKKEKNTGMVIVPNATIKSVENATELKNL